MGDTVAARKEASLDTGPKVERGGPTGSLVRIVERYLVPRFVASLFFLVRDRCLVSAQARVQLSSRVRLGRGTVVKPFAVVQTSGGRVSIGRDCAISCFNHLSTGEADLVIGDHVRLGPSVTIVASTRRFERKDARVVDQGYTHHGIRIGSDVLIGAGATLLDGSRIGDGAVIGAGSVVRGEVPPYTVVAGVPARVVSHRR